MVLLPPLGERRGGTYHPFSISGCPLAINCTLQEHQGLPLAGGVLSIHPYINSYERVDSQAVKPLTGMQNPGTETILLTNTVGCMWSALLLAVCGESSMLWKIQETIPPCWALKGARHQNEKRDHHLELQTLIWDVLFNRNIAKQNTWRHGNIKTCFKKKSEHMKSKQEHPQGLPCSWVAG